MNNFEIVEYNEFKAGMAKLRDMANFIPEVETKEGHQKSKRVSLDIRKVRTKLEAAKKGAKQYWIKGGQEVQSQFNELEGEILALIEPHETAYKEVDKIKKEHEKNRIKGLEIRIQAFVDLPEMLAENHSSEVAMAIDSLNTEECLDFYEFATPALKARNAAKQLLEALFVRKLKEEKDAIELEELRQLKIERDQRDHDERIKKEASEKAEAEARAAIEREEQAKRDQLKAEQDTLDAEKRLIEQDKQNKIDAENTLLQAIETEKQNKINIENARLQSERDQVAAAEQARLAEVARQEQEAETERLRVEKLEANKVHVGKIRGEIKEDLMKFAGLDEETARKVTLELSRKNIRNTQVNY
jgi:hypothetical protein